MSELTALFKRLLFKLGWYKPEWKFIIFTCRYTETGKGYYPEVFEVVMAGCLTPPACNEVAKCYRYLEDNKKRRVITAVCTPEKYAETRRKLRYSTFEEAVDCLLRK